MKIDLHVHSSERSACGRANDEEQVRAAMAAGLDALVFTDHHRLVPASRLAALNQEFAPFRVIGGIEVTCQGEDFIIFGVQEPALEDDQWKYGALRAFVRQRGGFIGLAHPFRYHQEIGIDWQHLPPDAIEIFSANTPKDARPRIRAIAEQAGIPTLCNSDAHSTERLGTYYNVLSEPFASELALIQALRGGHFTCGNC